MHDIEMQKRFIHLRAQGWSFARIAVELKVSPQTLVTWSRRFRFEIANLQAIDMEALKEQVIASRAEHVRQLAEQLKAVQAELAKRDLTEVSTSRLYSLAENLRQQIERATGTMEFSIPMRDLQEGETFEETQEWKP